MDIFVIFLLQSPNGKGRFYIRTVKDKFAAINIISVNISDLEHENKTQKLEIKFIFVQIYYENEKCEYVTIGENELSKSVYISSIILFHGNSYNYPGDNSSRYTTAHTHGMLPSSRPHRADNPHPSLLPARNR